MKIQFKWKYPWADGFMLGDLKNITEEFRILTYHIQTLNSWVTLHGSHDIIKIWPNQGEYYKPSEDIHLMKKREWKLVPKSKISMAKETRGRE